MYPKLTLSLPLKDTKLTNLKHREAHLGIALVVQEKKHLALPRHFLSFINP